MTEDKEYNWKDYRAILIQEAIKQYGTKDEAIVSMGAVIDDLRATNEGLQDIIKDIPDEMLEKWL